MRVGTTKRGAQLTLEQIQADPALRTRDDSGVVALAVGTVLWTIALIVVLLMGTGGDVLLVCAIGAALGVPGLALAIARRSRQRRRAQE